MLRSVHYTYTNQRGLFELSLAVNQGEVCGILGANGAGKSTAFKLIAGLLKPQRGQIFLSGQDVTHQPLWKRARQGLGYLSQEGALFDQLTVIENIKAAQLAPKDKVYQQGMHDDSAPDIMEIMRYLGILDLSNTKVAVLSGGERRRVELARLIALKPKVVLLDEPFAALDPHTISAMRNVIFMLKKRRVAVLLTDHQVYQAMPLCDRVYLLHEGKLVVEGSPQDVQKDQNAQILYLGVPEASS